MANVIETFTSKIGAINFAQAKNYEERTFNKYSVQEHNGKFIVVSKTKEDKKHHVAEED